MVRKKRKRSNTSKSPPSRSQTNSRSASLSFNFTNNTKMNGMKVLGGGSQQSSKRRQSILMSRTTTRRQPITYSTALQQFRAYTGTNPKFILDGEQVYQISELRRFLVFIDNLLLRLLVLNDSKPFENTTSIKLCLAETLEKLSIMLNILSLAPRVEAQQPQTFEAVDSYSTYSHRALGSNQSQPLSLRRKESANFESEDALHAIKLDLASSHLHPKFQFMQHKIRVTDVFLMSECAKTVVKSMLGVLASCLSCNDSSQQLLIKAKSVLNDFFKVTYTAVERGSTRIGLGRS
jgi:hypothetical protein